jgi:uncharacterized membrane protein
MNRNHEDYTVAVVQRALKNHRIRVTKASVREKLKTHPYYPSLLSICEVLNELNVENYPLKLSDNEILNLKPPYIVHFKERGGQIALLSKVVGNRFTFFESYKSESALEKGKFIGKCSGAVILLNPGRDSGEKDFKRRRHDELLSNIVFPLVILTTLIVTGFYVSELFLSGAPLNINFRVVSLILIRLTGIILSLMLVLHEFDIHNSFTDKLCHLTKTTSCNSVLHDRAARIFSWFGWADLGLIYFSGGLILCLRLTGLNDYSWLSLLAALALPYPVFSVLYQGAILKKWCPLCLGVQLILILEFVLLLPGLAHLRFTLSSTGAFIGTYLLTFIIYLLANSYYRERKIKDMFQIKYGTMKFNPAVVRSLFVNQKHFNIPLTKHSLMLGNKDSGIMLTAFMSLQCSHCARAFESLVDYLRSGEMIRINLVIVTKDKSILNTLYHLNTKGEEEKAIELLGRWYNTEPFSRQSFSEEYCITDAQDISDEVSNENLKLFRDLGVVGTPTFFVNGYRLPAQYTTDDLKKIVKYLDKKELEVQM